MYGVAVGRGQALTVYPEVCRGPGLDGFYHFEDGPYPCGPASDVTVYEVRQQMGVL